MDQYWMMNKPKGYLTAVRDRTRPTVMELLPPALAGLHPVGRLDLDTEGLLLLTDDGTLDRQLLRPEQHVEKLYFFKAFGRLEEEAFVLVRERSRSGRTARPSREEEKGGIRLPEVSFTWMVTFMTRGHGAVTLELTEAEALIVKEEDQGVLTWQGTRYLGWKKRA